jgi:hypothetical protein
MFLAPFEEMHSALTTHQTIAPSFSVCAIETWCSCSRVTSREGLRTCLLAAGDSLAARRPQSRPSRLKDIDIASVSSTA